MHAKVVCGQNLKLIKKYRIFGDKILSWGKGKNAKGAGAIGFLEKQNHQTPRSGVISTSPRAFKEEHWGRR